MDEAGTVGASTDDGRPAAIYIDQGALIPEEFDAALDRIVEGQGGPNRFVIRIRTAGALATLAEARFAEPAIERLVPAELPPVEGPHWTRFELGADVLDRPDGREAFLDLNGRDIEAFGLLLADAVLAPSTGMGRGLTEAARELGKPLVAARALCDPVPITVAREADTILDTLRRLDPEEEGRWGRPLRRHLFGRLDAVLTDGAAFWAKVLSPYHPRHVHWRRHVEKVAAATNPWVRWRTDAYFAKDDWHHLCPSRVVAHDGALARQFGWLDRAAFSGARQFRDSVWVIYALAGIAVIAAVAGSLGAQGGAIPTSGKAAWIELVALLAVVALVWWLHATRLQHRWTACRVGAEQLRVARMCLPLLVAPRMLLTPDSLPSAAKDGGDPAPARGWRAWLRRSKPRVDEAAAVVALVKRTIREEGPSALKRGTTVTGAAVWLRCIVSDQLDYHRANHDKLHAMEQFIRMLNGLFFLGAVVIVVLHLRHSDPAWGLLVTAGGPALAAALHGASGRLEIARRSDLSHAYAKRLGAIDLALETMIGGGRGTWAELRTLVLDASEAMGSEADAWHATMLPEPVSLP